MFSRTISKAWNSEFAQNWAQPLASALAIFAWLPFVAFVAFLVTK